MSEHDHTDWKALADEIERKDRRLAEAQSAIRTLVEAMQRLGVFHDSLREHPAIARVLPQARAMTDFTDQWANRHDPDCEGTGRIDGHAYCSCYRRWLEGRLTELEKQDEIHWKTRRTLLTEKESLEARLEVCQRLYEELGQQIDERVRRRLR